MHTKRLVLATLAMGLGLALGVGTIAYLASVPRVSASRLRSQVEANLPIGTPREKVEAWLAAQGMSWGDLMEHTSGRCIGLGGEIKEVYRLEVFSKTDIEFEFHFDERDQLLSFFIEEDIIGL